MEAVNRTVTAETLRGLYPRVLAKTLGLTRSLADAEDAVVVKLPKARVAELIRAGAGEPFAPAGRVFKEWLSVPKPDRRRWLALLKEGIAFVAG